MSWISGIVSFPGGRVEYFQKFIFNSTRQLSVYFTREFLYQACAKKDGRHRWSHRRMKIVSAKGRLHQRHSKIILRNTLAECSQQVKLLSVRRFEALHYTQFSGVRLTLKSETRISQFWQFSKKGCFIPIFGKSCRKRWKGLSVFRFFEVKGEHGAVTLFMFYDRKRKDTHKSSSCDGGPPVRRVCNAWRHKLRKRYCSRHEGALFRMYTDWQWPTRTQSCRLSRPSSHFSSARAFQATTSVCYLALANWNWPRWPCQHLLKKCEQPRSPQLSTHLSHYAAKLTQFGVERRIWCQELNFRSWRNRHVIFWRFLTPLISRWQPSAIIIVRHLRVDIWNVKFTSAVANTKSCVPSDLVPLIIYCAPKVTS